MTLTTRPLNERPQSALSSATPVAGERSLRDVWQVAAILLSIGMLCYFWLDYPVSRYLMETGRLPGDFAKLFEAAEHFGTIWGQLLILCVVFELDRERAYRIPRIASATLLGGLTASLIKLTVTRVRPKHFDFAKLGIEDSFSSSLSQGIRGADLQSFPSGHTASAVAFAVAMGWAYPKARPLFLVLAGLVAFQRVEATAHYISDTLVGAATGWVIACWFVENTRLSRWWTSREAIWKQLPDALVVSHIADPTGATQSESETSLLGQDTSYLIPIRSASGREADPTIRNAGKAA